LRLARCSRCPRTWPALQLHGHLLVRLALPAAAGDLDLQLAQLGPAVPVPGSP